VLKGVGGEDELAGAERAAQQRGAIVRVGGDDLGAAGPAVRLDGQVGAGVLGARDREIVLPICRRAIAAI
jgi:hypothetical protein